MITPSFPTTATSPTLPLLALDFTTGALDSRITFTRADATTCATYTNSSGTLTTAAANIPRFTYNPVTLAANGLIIEESRKNLLLNSAINGTSLSTQNVTVAASANTISFYGTGTIVLTGTYTGSLVGSGTYPTRSILKFTPTAGTLTVTVTGTVQYAQLELGAFVTSYIPTGASQVIRAADVAVITGTNFSSWFNQTNGTIYAEYAANSNATSNQGIATFGTPANYNYASTNTITIFVGSSTTSATYNLSGSFVTASAAKNLSGKLSTNYTSSGVAISSNGGTVVTGITSASLGGITSVTLGYSTLGALNGTIKRINYYPLALTSSQLQAITSN